MKHQLKNQKKLADKVKGDQKLWKRKNYFKGNHSTQQADPDSMHQVLHTQLLPKAILREQHLRMRLRTKSLKGISMILGLVSIIFQI